LDSAVGIKLERVTEKPTGLGKFVIQFFERLSLT